MKKGPACSLPWQLVSLIEAGVLSPEKLGEQRGSGVHLLPKHSVMFCVPMVGSVLLAS